MTPPCTGVILAGGENRRFSGKNKAFVQVAGKRILDHIYGVFSDLFEEIILVTNNPLQYLEWDFNIVTDLFSIRSSLTGIHAGLFYATNPHAFFAACDTPFLFRYRSRSWAPPTARNSPARPALNCGRAAWRARPRRVTPERRATRCRC